jgi:hypothetical protein
MYPAFMLETSIGSDCNLSGKPLSLGVNRCADDAGIARLNQLLTAYDYIDPLPLRIAGRSGYAVKFAPVHRVSFQKIASKPTVSDWLSWS